MTSPMRLERFGIILRPVKLDDAAFIVEQRRSPRAATYLGETKPSIESQRKWIHSQQQKKNDFYFLCVSRENDRIGTIGVTEFIVDEAHWGRFLIAPQFNAALQSMFILFDFCFFSLRLKCLHCTVVAGNDRARRLYEWVGHKQNYDPVPDVVIFGTPVAQVRYTLEKDSWVSVRAKVLLVAKTKSLVRSSLNESRIENGCRSPESTAF